MSSKNTNNDSELEIEIRNEFQLERMILFSDAVFAIVITLMAIEIHLPDTTNLHDSEGIKNALIHLLPTILAYVVSFIFIGVIWFQHLKIFYVLKYYDKGLVIRNLLLLFFIGLFPFAATVVTKGLRSGPTPFIIYFAVIICCFISQAILQHYILIKRPALRHHQNIDKLLEEYTKKKTILITLCIAFILVIITSNFIVEEDRKFMATYWIYMVPIVILIQKKLKKRSDKK